MIADPQLARLSTYVDTNGHALRRVWDQLVPVTDGFMVDLKALDPVVHHELTGRGNELVLDSIRYLHRRGRLAECGCCSCPATMTTPTSWPYRSVARGPRSRGAHRGHRLPPPRCPSRARRPARGHAGLLDTASGVTVTPACVNVHVV